MVERLMILDMIPGLGRTGDKMDLQAARRFWHVFFHAGMPDLAERLVSTNVRAYLSHFYTSPDYNYSPTVFSKEDIDEYVRVYSAPGALRAGFQYYATALNTDLENLKGCTEKLKMPVLAWGGDRFMANIVPVWEGVADNVQGGSVEQCGHFIAEEKPDFVIQQALEFFEPLR
jgi:pimeloyl-ACP methyl ester carboxylesterase